MPDIRRIIGTCAKPNVCAGCHQPISAKITQYCCKFSRSGFTQNNLSFRPCGVTYHLECIRVSEPFRTRLPDGNGLKFPNVSHIPAFICEACSVRSVLLRELRPNNEDLTLMKLERMRMIDLACSLASKTLDQYNYYLRRIQVFESQFKIDVLRDIILDHPPGRKLLPALWCQQWFAIQRPRRGRYAKVEEGQMTFGSARDFRSALGFHHLWGISLRHPGLVTSTVDIRGGLMGDLTPNESVEYWRMIEGMA